MSKCLSIPHNIIKNIPIIKNSVFNPIFNRLIPKEIHQIKKELNNTLVNESGILVVKNVIPIKLINKTNKLIDDILYKQIIPENDHFSNNLRIWNFFEKFCINNPELFINYFKNPVFNLVFQSYLGPKYTVSSQINIVEPGSKSQIFHRDYHLGLMDYNDIEKYPKNIQISSSNLTLQCLIAHTNINKFNGSTKLLPYSQKIETGYLDIKKEKTLINCEENYIQLNLNAGDVLFFNPAVYHAAGSNNSFYNRIGNILQINSAFSVPMEVYNYNLIKKKVSNNLTGINLKKSEFEGLKEMIFNKYEYPKKLDIKQIDYNQLPPTIDT